MASGMMRWSLATIVGVALVAIRLLPVGSLQEPRLPQEPRPERARFLAIQQEMTVAIEKGKIMEYRVNMKVTFILED